MKEIHRYIVKNFLLTFVLTFVFSVLLFVLSDFFSNLSSILENAVPFKYIAEYYLYYVPFIAYFTLPIIFGLSSLISLGFLSMRNEIIVMRSSGLSIFKVALPVMVLSLLISLVMFLAKESIVNYGLERASFIKNYYFKKQKFSGQWIKISNFFIKVNRIDVKNRTAYGVIAYKVRKDFGGISLIVQSKYLKIGRRKAEFLKGTVTAFPSNKVKSFKRIEIKFKKGFYSIVSSSEFREPSILELIRSFRVARNKDYYLASIIFDILYPFSCFVLALISFVFVLRITPRKSGFIKNVFIGGLVFLVYVGTFEMLSSMGKYSMVNPLLSMVIFVLFWIVISLYNLLKLGI